MKKWFLSASFSVALFFLAGLSTPVLAQGECEESYRVVRGDSLSKIAKRCGTTISTLAMANPDIKNPSRIFPGQILEIPMKPEPVSDESPTIVIRPKKDRLSIGDFDRLGIEAGGQTRWIDVDLSSQTVSAFQGRVDLQTFLASTGVWRTPTVTGQYQIYQRFETDDMRGPGYYLKDVPYTMYFYKDYGLHGTYWHSNFGQPMSHGCVNLSTDDARWLFEFASEGTLVNVHY